jgi:hypothetical protein
LHPVPVKRPLAWQVLQHAFFTMSDALQEQKRMAEFAEKLRKEKKEYEEKLENIKQREQSAADRERSLAAAKAEYERKKQAFGAKHNDKQQQQAAMEKQLQARQRVVEASLSALAPPAYWTSTSGLHKTRVWQQGFVDKIQALVEATSMEALHGNGADLRKQFKGRRWGALRVSAVYRLENHTLWERYSAFRQGMLARSQGMVRMPRHETIAPWMQHSQLKDAVNEVYLWHGTSGKLVDILHRQGLDNRVSATGGLFGMGIYFTEHVSKADQYCEPYPDENDINGTFTVILSRVCMGHVFQTKESRNGHRDPPPFPPGTGIEFYDSLLGDRGKAGQYGFKFREMVVYDRHQAYPEFAVEYKRTNVQ